jgi:predicted RNA-binding Zn-ribbon protein involved in translation (DUF1610 family)
MTLTKERTGLIKCPQCGDEKLYTPTGLSAHMRKTHGKHICPQCGVDIDLWPFKEPHNCQGEEGGL